MNRIYFTDIYIHMVTMFIILSFSILTSIYILFNDDYSTILRIFVILIISSAIYLLLKKDTFLPFLGMTYLPNNLLVDEKFPQGANLNYVLDMKDYADGTRIIYWAANKTDKIIDDPFEAYKDFHNVGISKVINGKATIRIFCPDKYKVRHFGVHTSLLDKHFHYRIIFRDSGLMSPVMTTKINC